MDGPTARPGPNANLCSGGAWVWDDTASYVWELPYHVEYSGLRLPAVGRARPARLRVADRRARPYRRTADALRDPLRRRGRLRARSPVRRDHGAQPPSGRRRPVRARHAPRPGRPGDRRRWCSTASASRSTASRPATGRGGRWPQGRPRKRTPNDAVKASGVGGIGYSFGTASPADSVPRVLRARRRRRPRRVRLPPARRRCTRTFSPANGAWRSTRDRMADAPRDRRRRRRGPRADAVRARAVSRHWKGHGGDTLMRWSLRRRRRMRRGPDLPVEDDVAGASAGRGRWSDG